jgi:hypothetical protein
VAQYDRQIATALKLVTKFGQKATWIQNSNVDDAITPWLVSADTASYEVNIAFLPYQRINHDFLAYLGKTEVPTGTIVGYMPGSGLSFLPALRDIVMRQDIGTGTTDTYRIDDIDRLAPNGQNILWTVYFKR